MTSFIIQAGWKLEAKRDGEWAIDGREEASTKLLNLCRAHEVPSSSFFKNPMRSIARHVRKLERESLFVSDYNTNKRHNYHLSFKAKTLILQTCIKDESLTTVYILISVTRKSKLTDGVHRNAFSITSGPGAVISPNRTVVDVTRGQPRAKIALCLHYVQHNDQPLYIHLPTHFIIPNGAIKSSVSILRS